MAMGRVEKTEDPIPTNLDESIEFLKRKIPAGELEEFKNLPERRAVGATHHGIGMHLRNTWGLWSGSELKDWFLERGVWHADDMSGIIIKSFHRVLNDKPIELEKQISFYFYKKYWDAHQTAEENGMSLRVQIEDGELKIEAEKDEEQDV